MMKVCRFKVRPQDWAHFVNGVCGDAGTIPSAETLVANWVIANTTMTDISDPATLSRPDPADAPPIEELIAAWHLDRTNKAFSAIQRHMEEVGALNAKRHALASAEAQITSLIEAEKALARQHAEFELFDEDPE
jgi:hypothetical protein